MTPLIDVLLVLLIIFMIVIPTQSVGLDANVPQPSTQPQDPSVPDRSVVVEIDKNLAVTINSEPTDMDHLGDRLAAIFKTRGERAIFVKAYADTEFRYIARAIDIARGAGIDKVGLLGDKSPR